jgi:hypothetical protein
LARSAINHALSKSERRTPQHNRRANFAQTLYANIADPTSGLSIPEAVMNTITISGRGLIAH